MAGMNIDLEKVTRVEVVGSGCKYLGYFEPGVFLCIQDDGKTLKIFVGEESDLSKQAASEALRVSLNHAMLRLSEYRDALNQPGTS
jgi:hypothetical protein